MAKAKGASKTGGRVKGTPNKVTAEVKDICRQHAPKIIQELVRLATKADTAAARIAASKEILDRAYGKAPQTIAGDTENPLQLKTRLEVVIIDPKSEG